MVFRLRRWAARGWRRPTRVGSVLLLGLLVREAFSFWTGHPYDFESWIRTAYVVAHGQNPYSAFWPAVPGLSFSYLGTTLTSAAYLPFWPLLLGALYQFWAAVGHGNRFVFYFLLKQPGILADVASAYLLNALAVRWTNNRRLGLRLATFWSFFPYAIIITAIWGQFDAIVVLLLLLLLYARGPLERNLVNGIGILVKWLTVIFLPLELFRERGWRRASWLVALLIPGLVTVAVFAAMHWTLAPFGTQGLASVALSQSRGEGLGMNYAFLLGLGPVTTVLDRVPEFYTVMPYLWVPGVIFAGRTAARWVRPSSPGLELRALLLVVTVFLLLRWGLYEQYLLYLFGLFVLDVVIFHPGRAPLFRVSVAVGLADLVVNNDFGLRFLGPIDTGLPSLTTQLDANDSYGLVRTVLLILLAVAVTATLIQIALTYLRDEPAPLPWPHEVVRRLRGRRGPTTHRRTEGTGEEPRSGRELERKPALATRTEAESEMSRPEVAESSRGGHE